MSCSCGSSKIKITIVGACGGTGQPLSFLLKQNPKINELCLFDISNVEGIAMDLSHINTSPKVVGYSGPEKLKEALTGSTIVVIVAAIQRKPGMTRETFFDTSAVIVQNVIEAIVEVCPTSMICLITNPVNSLVPLASEIMKKYGRLDVRKIFGLSTLDLVRASTFVAQKKGLDPTEVKVPVIGGHSGATMVPLLSQTFPSVNFTEEEIKTITQQIVDAGPMVVKAKNDLGAATFSTAYSAARFLNSLIDGIRGKPNIVDYAVVRSDITQAKYFTSAVLLGKNGVEKVIDIGKLSKFEDEALKRIIPVLQEEIKLGEDFVLKQANQK